jgi:hypothetical protein
MELFHIDALCLQDVRLFSNEARRLKKHAAAMLGPGCLIKASILTPHPDPETLRQSNRVGGQLLIVSPRWGRRCVSSWTDDSGLGLAVGLIFAHGQQRIQLISSYSVLANLQR